MKTKKMLASVGIAAVALCAFSGCGANVKYETNRYENLGSVRNIVVEDTCSTVRIMPSTDGAVSVECKDLVKVKHSVSVQGDTLVVKYKPKWYQTFSFSNVEPFVTIYLPEGEYDNLSVEVSSGDVEIPAGYLFKEAELDVTSGRVQFCAAVTGDLDVEGTSGEIILSGASCKNLDVELTSGEIVLKDLAVSEDLAAECSSGEISFSSVTAGDIYIELTSGEINASGLIASGKMQVKGTSGDVVLERCDAAELDLTLTSGDLRGTLLTPKYYNVKVTSGTVNVPDDDITGGKCTISVTSGRVDLSIVKE